MLQPSQHGTTYGYRMIIATWSTDETDACIIRRFGHAGTCFNGHGLKSICITIHSWIYREELHYIWDALHYIHLS
jgi:hypothetical protein